MAEWPQPEVNASNSPQRPFQVEAPQISLPKGGGAIRGIGEKFSANPVTGTGAVSVPVFASAGRLGFGPQLSLSYDSGSGNSPFGFGWTLALPSITRKTDKGLPEYRDAEESDTFILSSAEDLVPVLLKNAGTWVREVSPTRTVYGQKYAIHYYRPRVDGLFARIERWVNQSDPGDIFWRSISKDNITTWYGKDAASRVADPSDPTRIFSWLICESYDDKGNVISYQHKPEDSTGVDLSQANEHNRSDLTRSANRYIKHILYGNQSPYFPDLTADAAVALPSDWCFDLVFDYGEHALANPVPDDAGHPWNLRLDPFSTYRPTFEVRTYRLCRRVLMFHNFPTEASIGANCLVRSTDLAHAAAPTDPTQPSYSYLLSVVQTGYVRDPAGGYDFDSLPPLEFEYTTAQIDETVRDVDAESIKNLPYGLAGPSYRWADLDGEGLSGVLTEQGGAWFYKPNWSPVNRQTVGGEWVTLAKFGPTQVVGRRPSLASLEGGRQQLLDLSGDGKLDLVQYEGPAPGYCERTQDASWNAFQSFDSLPVLDWKNPNLKFIDLTGDGFPDLLISEENVFKWHLSLSTQGFGPAHTVPRATDEEKSPQLIFADSTETIFLADMSGDGLTDLVRIRNGAVCYWPNLGYGHFGPKVGMDGSPYFDNPDLFDGRRVRLADIDGSGTTDILYISSDKIEVYLNESGNAFGAERVLSNFPSIENPSSATTIDLLGSGTACLVWSSPLPGDAGSPMRYIDLMGGHKPHLLIRVTNNFGAETVVHYAPSTKFYVADKLAGTPWLTRLPFPVQVVERIETYDYISRNLFTTRYAYHHGFYDGVEREFRGFGRVDQWDTEDFATLSASSSFPAASNISAASSVPPVLTKTWFHTGAYFGETVVTRQFEKEYYSEGDSAQGVSGLAPQQLEAMLPDETVLPLTVLLPDGSRIPYDFSPEELREACRGLRGSILRQEIYALDGSSESDRPYTASERNYTIEAFQPQGPNRFAAFCAHPRESVDFNYERKLYEISGSSLADSNNPPPGATIAADPRVTHTLTLSVDPYGNVLQSVIVSYGRRYTEPALTATDQSKQSTLLATCTENSFTNAILANDSYRIPLPAESDTYELIQIQPASKVGSVTNLFGFDELESQVTAASDGNHDISYENLNPTGLNPGQPYRRLIGTTRTLYRPNDMGGAANDPTALLNLKVVESLALPGASYRLAFTPGLIQQVYQRRGAALVTTPATLFGSTAADGGGYVDLDGDGHWWIPSGRVYYLPAAGTPAQEIAQATGHFYLPRRFEDPFGNSTSIDYDDPHNLLPIQRTDAIGNIATANNDYRVLQPTQITDPNGSVAQVQYDILGLVVGTAVNKGALGDSFGNFSADLTQAQIDAFYQAADPHTLAVGLLGTATTRIVYNLQQFVESQAATPSDPTRWTPVWAASLSRETHVSDLAAGAQTKIHINFSYSDGFGREIQKKVQAEPGPVRGGGLVVNPRWVGSGWTIFNNKGKPVRKYEPFFSQLPANGHQFEFGVQVGVSPILFYDPVERVVATAHPNQTYEKVVFDPWTQETWDVNDTVLQANPANDPDVGVFFAKLPAADYIPTWYVLRNAGGLGTQEQKAAAKAAAHANTPTVAYFGTLGRTFLTVADNATGGKYPSRLELDIQSNQRAVRDAVVQAGDAQGRIVMRYSYDMLQNRIDQASMEAGERWILNDSMGKPIRKWDSRGHNFRAQYDALRRPTGQFVIGTDAANSDPRTLAGEILFEQTVYGEGQITPNLFNLRTRIFQHGDGAGLVTNQGTNPTTGQNESYDFKGNLLRSQRAAVSDYKSIPNWSAAPATGETYASSTQYDAMNRPTALTTPDASAILGLAAPDASVIIPTYNEANLLETISVNFRGSAASTAFITKLDYNAKAQRVLVEYANNTNTAYTYDLSTFRMVNLTTTRTNQSAAQQTVQDLTYTYDPIGNITHIQDDADTQNVIFFRNRRVEPSGDYIYDAIYRLIQAVGREQLGLDGSANPRPPWPTSYNDVPRIFLTPLQQDGNAVGKYFEQYNYDPVGNLKQFIHQGTNPANPGWTRAYTYNEPSLLEPAKVSNRLSSTALSGSETLNEPYTYDAHGNMTSMPQLQTMLWDFKDQLYMTQRQPVNGGDTEGTNHQGECTYYVYDALGQRVRKTTESKAKVKLKERMYLGVFELYREYDSTGATTLARETLQVMGDKKRVALVETTAIDASQPAASLPMVTTRYQFDNHLGTACLELDETSAIIAYEEYYPYGSTSFQAGRTLVEVSLKRYRYTGKERDEESGLYYHGARYYACWLGRWTSSDPISLGDGPNLYLYCSADPIMRKDAAGTEGPYVDISDDLRSTAEDVDKAGLAMGKKPSGTSLTELRKAQPRMETKVTNTRSAANTGAARARRVAAGDPTGMKAPQPGDEMAHMSAARHNKASAIPNDIANHPENISAMPAQGKNATVTQPTGEVRQTDFHAAQEDLLNDIQARNQAGKTPGTVDSSVAAQDALEESKINSQYMTREHLNQVQASGPAALEKGPPVDPATGKVVVNDAQKVAGEGKALVAESVAKEGAVIAEHEGAKVAQEGLAWASKSLGKKALQYVPFVGMSIGAASATYNWNRGHYEEAFWDAISIPPVGGDVTFIARILLESTPAY